MIEIAHETTSSGFSNRWFGWTLRRAGLGNTLRDMKSPQRFNLQS